MAFMQPEIIHDLFLTIETRDGDTVIPADLVGSLVSGPASMDMDNVPRYVRDLWESALRPYLDSHAPIQSVTAKHAYGARLSAPGYMDCTEWALFDSEAEAREYLADTYGDDSEEG